MLLLLLLLLLLFPRVIVFPLLLDRRLPTCPTRVTAPPTSPPTSPLRRGLCQHPRAPCAPLLARSLRHPSPTRYDEVPDLAMHTGATSNVYMQQDSDADVDL